MEEELRSHFECEVERQVQRGVSLPEAHALARRALGNAAATRQEMREALHWRWLAAAQRDTAYALRALRRSPGFAFTVVGTIAVALGLNSTVFTIFNAYVLRPLAVRDPGALYDVTVIGRSGREQWTDSWLDWEDYQTLTRQNPAFAGAVAHRYAYLRIDGVPSMGELVSGNYFRMLGVGTIKGRPLLMEDAPAFGEGAVLVLSHRMWTRRFGADPAVVGSTVRIRGLPFTVVGVVGPEFTGLTEVPVDFWAPITMTDRFEGNALRREATARPRAAVLGRLQPGVSPARAEALVSAWVSGAANVRRPAGAPDRRIQGATLEPHSTTIHLSAELVLIFTPIAVAFLLIMVIACANVANMMLARGLARQREIGIRLALGAGRRELVRQLLTEAGLLALPAAVLGYFLSRAALEGGLRWMFASFPPSFQAYLRIVPLSPDYRVFLFTLAGSFAAALLFGLVPALQSTRLDLVRATRGEFGGGRHPGRLRNALVVAQIAGCLLLLVVAGVLLRGSERARRMETGLRTAGVIQLEVNDALRPEALAVLRGLPGVGSIAAATDPPAAGRYSPAALSLVGAPAIVSIYFNRVSSEYFQKLGLRVLQGRTFSQVEAVGGYPVVVLSETAARRLVPAGSPIGREVSLAADDTELKLRRLEAFRTVRIIGVVSDAMAGMVFTGVHTPIAYYPVSAETAGTRLLLSLPGPVHAAQRFLDESLDRAVPGALDEVYDLDQAIATQVFPMRVASWISGLLGAIALLLTLTGTYGVLSYVVGQRTREIGIRMALGAESIGVVKLVLWQSLRLALIGGMIGLSLALTVSTIFATGIEGVRSFDPVAYGGSAALALLACLAAASLPAARAARVDPLEALRAE